MADERSLVRYLAPIRKHSLIIVSLALLAFVLSVITWANSLHELPYQAEAIIMFRPNNGGQIDLKSGQFSSTGIDFARQQQNISLLATSMEIAHRVAQVAATSDDAEARGLGAEGDLALHDRITIETRGSFLALKAKAPTAHAATWLANTWAQEAVRNINAIYASPSPNVQQAIDDVKGKLDKDQAALQQFLDDDPTFSLRTELTRTVEIINGVLGSQVSSDLLLLNSQRESIRNQIEDSYRTTRALDTQLGQLSALRTKIQNGPDDQASLFGNQIALLTVINNVVSGNANTQVQLQLNVTDLGKGPLTRSSQLNDVDSTIGAVQKLQSDVSTKIAGLQQKYDSLSAAPTSTAVDSASPTVQQYLQRYNQLKSQLETKNFELNTLTRARDQDQSTYDLLRNRLAEQQVNQLVSGLIDVGAPANEAQTAKARSPLRSLALVAGEWTLLAIAIGSALAFILSLLSPSFSSNAFVRNSFRRGARARLSGGSSSQAS
jgi:predicted  nucleic acid-binding Zn-ribbon protein